jgi:hypothetical protein
MENGSEADAKLHEIRSLYEPYMTALAESPFAPLPNWPPGPDAKYNWQRTAAGAGDLPGVSGKGDACELDWQEQEPKASVALFTPFPVSRRA